MRYIFLAFVGFVTLYIMSIRRKSVKSLPDMSDEDFVARFAHVFLARPEQVIEGRNKIARILGVPPEKLAPEHVYKDLAQRFGTFGSFSVAWSDLEYEVQEIAGERGASLEAPPSTVGDLVAGLIQARRVVPVTE